MVTVIDRLLLKIEVDIKKADAMVRRIQNLLLGMGLSFLFTGMAIKKFFENALNSILQTFLAVEGENNIFSDSVGELMAKWEFLKWSIADAVAQTGLWDILMGKVQGLIDKFNDLDESQKATVGKWIVYGAIIGTVMMVIGMALLFLLGPLALIKFLLGAEGLLGAFRLLGRVALFLFTNPFGIALLAIIITLFLLSQKLGGLKNAFKALGIFIMAVFAAIIDTALFPFIKTINGIIAGINMLISAFNKLSGSSISKVGEISTFGLSKKVWEMRNALIAEGEASKNGETTNNIDVTIQGDVKDDNTIQKMIKAIQDKIYGQNGSPQLG